MLTRGSSLSDDNVIDLVNNSFVPVELNITDQGFPKSITGLRAWQKAYATNDFYKTAFATSLVLTSDGSMPLASSGAGFVWQWRTSANYHPDGYLAFLRQGLKRFQQLPGVASGNRRSEKAEN
jgi:hypothetical protein